MNKNKNPVAENTIQEVQKEILRMKNSQGPINDIELCLVLRNINKRTRCSNLTPKEVMLRRDNLTHQPIQVMDEAISQDKSIQVANSAKATINHREKFKKRTPEHACSGDY